VTNELRAHLRHAAIVIGAFTALIGWLFARPLIDNGYIAETDIYEQFLPQFLAPATIWSSFEFGGTPAFADPGEATPYPLYWLFARVIPSWTAYLASAYVVAATGTYAYVYSHTRSRLAAACAAIAYGLSEALIERIAHVAIVHAMAWLPIIALAVDRLRGENWKGWLAIGAIAMANCFLAGQPQIFLYAVYAIALYGLAGGIVERAPLRYYAAGLGLAMVGVMLAGVKALPGLEASTYTSRQIMNFGQFVSHSNTPDQMLSLILPAVVHEGREAPTYVGLLTLLFAFVSVRHLSSNWRVGFWIVIGVVALMLGMGGDTPAARVAYELPFYDRFRIVGRHLFLAAFAAAALAGFGISAVQRRAVSWRVVIVAAALLFVIVGGSAAVAAASPARFFGEGAGGIAWGQIALAGLSIAAAVAFFRYPHRSVAAAGLLVILGVDLVSAADYDITPAGFAYEVLPSSAVQPSVHTVRLRDALSPARQRLLAPAGTGLDAIAPASFARVWDLPIAGGYGPMLLGSFAELAMMQRSGSVDPAVLADSDRALDVMAVKFVVLPRRLFDPGPVFHRHGVLWTQAPAALPVGPPECGQRHARHAAYALPADTRIAAVAMTMKLRCSEDVPDGTRVGTLTVAGRDGALTIPLRAGIEVSDEGLGDPSQRWRVRHKPAAIFDEAASRYSYVLNAQLPRPLDGVRLEFTLDGTAGSMEIERLTALAADGSQLPQNILGAILSDTSRWRIVDVINTSRLTDRNRDETSDNEEPFVVAENRRALRRAWLVPEVLPLPARDRDIALHHTVLPDGRQFDPAASALVDMNVPARRYAAGPSRVQVRSISDGHISVVVSSEGGGFLVLSEAYYPGWRARIDGALTEVYLTNGALQGVHVPSGTHAVEFVFASTTLAAGRAVSVSGVVVILAVLLSRLRDVRRTRDAGA
jgi:hypothetical protein